jgi:hypothetical protein
MQREQNARQELKAQIYCYYAEAIRRIGDMDAESFERLYRKIHCLTAKLKSFRGGIYDDDK